MSIARVILLLILLLVFPGKLYLEEFCCYDKLDKPPLHSSLNTGRKCSGHLAETPVSEILHARQHGCALCPQQHFLVPALQLGVLDLNLSSISHLWTSVSSKVAGNWDGKLGYACCVELSLVSPLIQHEETGLLGFLLLYFPRWACDRKSYFQTNCDSYTNLTEDAGFKKKKKVKTVSILKKLGTAVLLIRLASC